MTIVKLKWVAEVVVVQPALSLVLKVHMIECESVRWKLGMRQFVSLS